MEMRTCKKLHVEFEVTPPAQMDGEQIVARVYDVSILPRALRVL
jgi:diacylglycerol kinase family enzyme